MFRHTPEGVPLSVVLVPLDTGACRLLVTDGGPALPQELGPAHGGGRVGSTGLGLNILGRTATRSGGQLVLGRSEAGGAAIAVDLGPAPQPTTIMNYGS